MLQNDMIFLTMNYDCQVFGEWFKEAVANNQASVVQRVDVTIHWITQYLIYSDSPSG